MGQQFTSPYSKTKTAVVLFVKGAVTPIVLYFENPMAEYEDFQNCIKNSTHSAKLIEKTTIGPVKRISIMSNQIVAVAIQEEQFN